MLRALYAVAEFPRYLNALYTRTSILQAFMKRILGLKITQYVFNVPCDNYFQLQTTDLIGSGHHPISHATVLPV
jgi:hypothetical protein